MKKLDLSKFRITTKRDWIIFWVFVLLLANAVAGWSRHMVDRQLRRFGSPWLWFGNEPQFYGRLILLVALLIIVGEIVCFLRHKRLGLRLAILAAGTVMSVVLVGAYQIHCRMIVSAIWEEDPVYMRIVWKEQNQSYMPTEEEQAAILDLCRQLTIVSDESKEREYIEWHWTPKSEVWEKVWLSINFDEHYGHNVHLSLYIRDDTILLDRGVGPQTQPLVTVFEDNGLIQYIENIKQEQIEAAE